MRSILAVFGIWLLIAGAVWAQGFSALARLDPANSQLVTRSGKMQLTLDLSQPVPYRVHIRANPPRLVLDFREVDFSNLNGEAFQKGAATAVQAGRFQEGWSRFVLKLDGPWGVDRAGMKTNTETGRALVTVNLSPRSAQEFAKAVQTADSIAFPNPAKTLAPPPRREENGRLRIMLDPGHGGIDPGAIRDEIKEADLVLAFAIEVKDALLRAGDYDVFLTRDADVFVSLEGRIAQAKRAGADVMISIHADAVAEGIARGAQIFTLAEDASSDALQLLAERHDQADLLAGVDLTGQGDDVALALMSIARAETLPRTEALADAMVLGLREAGVRLHKRPREMGAFSVLKSPDLPAILLEIGFMSSPEELQQLRDPLWRAKAVTGVVNGVNLWATQDAVRKEFIRQ